MVSIDPMNFEKYCNHQKSTVIINDKDVINLQKISDNPASSVEHLDVIDCIANITKCFGNDVVSYNLRYKCILCI